MAEVCRRAWFSGPATTAAVRITSSQVRAASCRLAALIMIPHPASTTSSPAQYQEWANTCWWRGRPGHLGQDGVLDPEPVGAPGQQTRRQQRRRHEQDGRGPANRDQAAACRYRDKQRERGHERIEHDRAVRGGVGQRQCGAARGQPPGAVVSGADYAPGRRRDQQHGQGVIGGERAQVQRRA